jgi:hypothetical protein
MMILFFSPFSDHLLLLSNLYCDDVRLEYFVGWFLEATTHIKYWDYSHHKFNLHGRISLFICCGGAFWPMWRLLGPSEVERLFAVLPPWLCYTLAGSTATLLVLDTITTIRKLTLTAKLITKLDQVSSELRLQVSLGKAELSDRLEAAVDNLPLELRNHLDDAREGLPTSLDEASHLLREKYDELLAGAERYSRRFRTRYRDLSFKFYSTDLEDIKRAGLRYKEKIMAERAAKKKNRRAS